MLFIAFVMADEDVEIDGLVEGRFVGEAEVVDAFAGSHEFVFVADLVVKLFDLLPTGSLDLTNHHHHHRHRTMVML